MPVIIHASNLWIGIKLSCCVFVTSNYSVMGTKHRTMVVTLITAFVFYLRYTIQEYLQKSEKCVNKAENVNRKKGHAIWTISEYNMWIGNKLQREKNRFEGRKGTESRLFIIWLTHPEIWSCICLFIYWMCLFIFIFQNYKCYCSMARYLKILGKLFWCLQ